MHYQGRLSSKEPTWYSQQVRRDVPSVAADWLFDEESLTAKLIRTCQRRCDGRFSVKVIRQYWGRPFYSERKLLSMRRGEMAFIREVKLHCNDNEWVFARTLIPAGSFTGKARRLAFLGNKPLGAVLFADRASHRRLMQFAVMQPTHEIYRHALSAPESTSEVIWGRRTVFVYGGKPLLVNEIFLPKLLEAS